MIEMRDIESRARERERRIERRAKRRERRFERRGQRRELMIVGLLGLAQILAALLTAYLTATPGSTLYDKLIKSAPAPERPEPILKGAPR